MGFRKRLLLSGLVSTAFELHCGLASFRPKHNDFKGESACLGILAASQYSVCRNSGDSTWAAALWIGFTAVVFLDTSNLLLNFAQLQLPSRKLIIQVTIGFWMSSLHLVEVTAVTAPTGPRL